MTTATATQDDRPAPDGSITSPLAIGNDDIGGNVGMSGDEDGDEDEDPAMLAAMEAGRARASGDAKRPNGDTDRDDDLSQTATTTTGKQPADTAATTLRQEGFEEDEPGATDESREAAVEDPEVPGLGMKVSEVRAKFDALDWLQKALASANGNIGHLKTLIQNAPKGKPITKEALQKVAGEFGDEFASALADDLTAAGIGGGYAADPETLNQLVNDRVAEARNTFELKLVRMKHADFADVMPGGKQRAEFDQYVATLPAATQQQLADTWDSDVIIPIVDGFKASRDKAAKAQATRNNRIERATTPTQGRSGAAVQPDADPMEAGYASVRGNRGQQGARR